MGFHFASQFLTSDSLGNYLDVSSPWLFPFTLLSKYQAASATLLTVEAMGLRSLLGALKVSIHGEIRCVENHIPLEDDDYDTITSLWDLNEGPEQCARDVRSLWRALRPGGTLLLSVPCAKKAAERPSANRPRLYDAAGLEHHIFDGVGQPKRYAIYGPQTLPCGNAGNAAGGWAGSLAIGRDWRCYSGLHELPGEGIIVMKFSRPEHKSEATSIALTPRLN
jgi:SAM-dependent methyltransferase